MRSMSIFLLISGGGLGARAALPPQDPPAAQEPANPSPPPAPETEQVQEPQPSPPQPVTQAGVAGSMEPPQGKEMLYPGWVGGERVNDPPARLPPQTREGLPGAGGRFKKKAREDRHQKGGA